MTGALNLAGGVVLVVAAALFSPVAGLFALGVFIVWTARRLESR